MPSSGLPTKTSIKLEGTCGRADLAAALADGDRAFASAVAEVTGYEWQPPPSATLPERPPSSDEEEAPVHSPPLPQVQTRPLLAMPVWMAVHHDPIGEEPEPAIPAPRARYAGWRQRPTDPPPIPPLASWRELEPRLRQRLCLPQHGGAVDLELAISRISRAQFLERLPQERRRRWGPALQIIEDRSRRLIPYRGDQYLVRQALRRLLPAHALSHGLFRDGFDAPQLVTRTGAENYVMPPPGTIVLVLGDLGALSTAGTELYEHWLRFGRDLCAAGCRPVALIPAPLARCPDRLAQVWDLIAWERRRPRDHADTPAARAARLLRLVSPAIRIEPGMLRAARGLLPPSETDAGTEADVWQHPSLISRASAAATLDPERARQFRAEFARLIAPGLQARLAALLRSWRGYLPEEIWFEELLNLPPAARATAKVAQDLPAARNYFAEFTRLCDGGEGAASGNDLEWFGRLGRRAEAQLWRDEEVGEDLLRLNHALHGERPDYRPPPGFEPALIRRPDQPVRRYFLCQRGASLELLRLEREADGFGVASPLGVISSRNGLVMVEPLAGDPERNAFWDGGLPPPWASDWGWDQLGAWVELSLEDGEGKRVSQRLRWIEPGRFLMGSPEDEPARLKFEGPRHEVVLEKGFWLFDTVCTQDLWQAVMGENPSRFQGASRPVERVSWEEVPRFIETLNQRLPGLELTLPSEAQWEYACRAGTTTPFSFGATITPEQVNYNGDYPYAGGTRGLNRQEMVPVKSLPPNAWGLHEMHGNVREWVQDVWHGSYEGAPTDGSPWERERAGAERVIRGGSWFSHARYCRSAYRDRNRPDYRNVALGFRCARGQGREPSQRGGAAERLGLARPDPRSGSGRAAPGPGRGGETGEGSEPQPPKLLRLDVVSEARAAIPRAPALLLRTDREHLTLCRITKPAWAESLGRDRYGLWSEIAVARSDGEPIVQRLRWIPPGQFLMGSPPDKPGRYEDEGPQYTVTLREGYWLFDTPCTQALWEALLGENPSRFRDPERPVENVSWDDVQQRFLPALNARLPGFRLPTEAQWEHACRAGTETALYTGPIEILGERYAPALDPIAWYGGNSGVDFDLEEGEDSSDWSEKQYPHTRAGSRRVKLKRPNPWGLFDMLGNVWEWVEDAWHGSYEGAPRDGSAWGSDGAGAERVLRGGSWISDARYCRSANRSRNPPAGRIGLLGFRCARGQS